MPLERIGHLLVAAEPRTLVSVGTVETQHEFCLLWFGVEGSIYVQPRLEAGRGVVSSAVYTAGDEAMFNLLDRGQSASRTAKLSHHPDGRVHFSQHGHVPAHVGRSSFPLATGVGKVFDLKVFNPEKLRRLVKEKKDRAHVRLQWSGGIPGGAVLSGYWASIQQLLDEVPRGPLPTGPMVHLPVGMSGATVPRFLLRQPRGRPFRDHLLVLGLSKGVAGPSDELSALLVGGMANAPATGTKVELIASMFPFEVQATTDDEPAATPESPG